MVLRRPRWRLLARRVWRASRLGPPPRHSDCVLEQPQPSSPRAPGVCAPRRGRGVAREQLLSDAVSLASDSWRTSTWCAHGGRVDSRVSCGRAAARWARTTVERSFVGEVNRSKLTLFIKALMQQPRWSSHDGYILVVKAPNPYAPCHLCQAMQQLSTALIYGGIYRVDASQRSIQAREPSPPCAAAASCLPLVRAERRRPLRVYIHISHRLARGERV